MLPAMFLGNPCIKVDHLPHKGVARLGSSLGLISNLIGWEGSFNAFKGFKKLPDTLRYRDSSELILVLSVPRNQPKEVACQVGVIKGFYYLCRLCSL